MNRFLICCLLVAMLGLVACETQQKDDEAKPAAKQQGNSKNLLGLLGAPSADDELMSSAQAPAEDLAVPMGFTLEEASSRSYHLPGKLRIIDQFYLGNAHRDAVHRYLSKAISKKGWQLESDERIKGMLIMQWTKGEERLRIVVNDAPHSFSSTLRLHVLVLPTAAKKN